MLDFLTCQPQGQEFPPPYLRYWETYVREKMMIFGNKHQKTFQNKHMHEFPPRSPRWESKYMLHSLEMDACIYVCAHIYKEDDRRIKYSI